MLVVKYSNGGQAIKDVEAEGFVLDNYYNATDRTDGQDVVFEVANENVIMAVRVLIREGHIEPSNIRVLWYDQDMFFDRDGRFLNWQNSFAGNLDQFLQRMVVNERRRRG